MALWLCHSVILFVRYRNYFPVVQFQNKAHIRNPHDPVEVSKTMGAAGARNMGRRGRPNFFFLFFLLPLLKAVANGRPRHPKCDAKGATPPESEGDPAGGGYFASIL